MSELDIMAVAGLLGVSRPRVWQLRKQSTFPEPRTDDTGREVWSETAILRWAAAAGRLAERAPLLFRPLTTTTPARYLGTTAVQNGTVLTWDTALGTVCMFFYSHTARFFDALLMPNPADLDADTVVVVTEDHGLWGPELSAVDAAFPERTYRPQWPDLARVFGTPAPWWPLSLRRPTEMDLWQPGARPTVIHPIPDVETGPLLQLASNSPDGSSVEATLTWLARRIQTRSDDRARQELKYLEEWSHRESIAPAAVPTPAGGELPEPDEVVRRDAWLTLLARTDSLAATCVRLVLEWDGGRDLPFSRLLHLDSGRDELAREYLDRLQPCERTAAFALFSAGTVDETFTDPLTGAPAAKDGIGQWRVGVPRRLLATTALAEVTLDYGNKVWIRTADGHLWPAPEGRGTNTAFGYDGTGPRILAVLLDRLLDDINAPAPTSLAGATPNPGLLAGTSGGWLPDTTLTRADLETARSKP